MDVVSKSLGDEYSSAEFNQSNNELENAITSAGITLSSGDLFQLGKTIANYTASGDFYTDSGAADAYVLTAQASKQSPTAYVGGFRARFTVGNTNTGASTINVAALGVKNIKRRGGSVLQSGDLVAGRTISVEYDGTNFIFEQQDSGIIQQVNIMDGSVATGSTILPIDSSIPQNTEGDEYMTLGITPTSAANTLTIDVVCNIVGDTTAFSVATALFQDSTVNALAAVRGGKAQISGAGECMSFRHWMVAGTTSLTTFKVRAGLPTAGTATFNGSAGVVTFGGVMASSITITEIKA